MAGLKPGAAIIELMNDDGTMARRPQLHALCERHGLKMCSVADVIEYRLQREKLVERIDAAPFQSEYGQFQLIAYRSLVDSLPHVALVRGDVGTLDPLHQPVDIQNPVLVRMHSQNLLGDVFGDMEQPSGRTLRQAMRMIDAAGEGALVYLRHEMTGSGLLQRLQTLHLPAGSHQPDQHVPRFGPGQPTPGIKPPPNKGAYGIGCQILRDLGVRRMRLITNHPFMPTAMSGFGLEITEFVPLQD
jgi:3,4-dihydroxy 2-butanone 4-phosphate synthase/GTP cyclohydrolase II